MTDNQPPASPPARRRLLHSGLARSHPGVGVRGWDLGADAASIVWPRLGATDVPHYSSTMPTPPTSTPAAQRVVYTPDWSHGADGWVQPPSVHVPNENPTHTHHGAIVVDFHRRLWRVAASGLTLEITRH
jgi:hypothetical protein